MDPNYQYGYQPHQTFPAAPAPNYNYYNTGYAPPPAYNPGWTMPSGHTYAHAPAQGYCAPLPPQPITVINYQPPPPVPLPVAYDYPPQNHYRQQGPMVSAVAPSPMYQNAYLQPQTRHLVPGSAYQPIPQPSGFSATLGRVGILGKHEKKRIRKIQKENDKMAIKQRKGMTYVY